jgi:acetyl-CoA acyltransferase
MSAARPVFIVDAVRTAVARGRANGALATLGVHPVDLLASVIGEVTGRSGPTVRGAVEDVVAGCVTPIGKQGANVGRLAGLKAGLPITTPGVQLNRMCGSGAVAVQFASQAIAAGDQDVAVACGVEMMSQVQMGSDTPLFGDTPESRAFKESFPYPLIHQGVSAELLAAKYGVTRKDCDDFAVRSHRLSSENADAIIAKGSEILPTKLADGSVFNRDEGVSFPVNEEKLRSLKTIFKPEGGVVTAGNASQISDGAAAVLLASQAGCDAHGLKPRARIVARAVVGSDPEIMLDGVIPATELVLKKAGMTMADIDITEINEAFACVPLAWAKKMGVSDDKFNVRGGAISSGHPLGATGAVLTARLINILEDQDKRFGLVTLCIGHGQAVATIIERV